MIHLRHEYAMILEEEEIYTRSYGADRDGNKQIC